jgi:hemoglobin
MASETLFEKYGGFASVFPIVNAFYDSVLDSEIVSYMFDDVDMEKLIEHQTIFISELMGGPGNYDDRQLIAAHRNLNINEEEWDEVVTILVTTLQDFSVDEADINALAEKIVLKKPMIVTAAA